PCLATIANREPDQVIPKRPSAGFMFAAAGQARPSGEVRTVFDPPTATNRVPDQTIFRRSNGGIRFRVSHVLPLAEVTIVPPSPTATSRESDEVIPKRSSVV